MKKTLHGKRHIRAQASVRVGRAKRQQRKIDRDLIMIEKALAIFKSTQFQDAFAEAIRNAVIALNRMGEIMREVAQRAIYKMSQQSPPRILFSEQPEGDLRVYIDGVEVRRWIAGEAIKIWKATPPENVLDN